MPKSQAFLIVHVKVFVKLLQGIPSQNVSIAAENDFFLATSTFLQVQVPLSVSIPAVQVPVLS